MKGAAAMASIAAPSNGRYQIQPRAMIVRDRLIAKATFIMVTPSVTTSLTIGNQSTGEKSIYMYNYIVNHCLIANWYGRK